MYVPQDFKDMIKLMSEGKISAKGIESHYYRLDQIKKEVFKMIDNKEQPFMKMLTPTISYHEFIRARYWIRQLQKVWYSTTMK